MALNRSHSWTLVKYTNNNTRTVQAWAWASENSQERGDRWTEEKVCFTVRLERAQGGCLMERQREFVPGKDRERARANSRKFGSSDSETESIRCRAEGA